MVSFSTYKVIIIQSFFIVFILFNEANALLGHNANCSTDITINDPNKTCDISIGLECKVASQDNLLGKCQCTVNTVYEEESKKCQCIKNFIEENGSCIGALGKKCSPTKGCNSDRMFCDPHANNTCSCSLNYASTGEDCFLRIGTSCSANDRCGGNNATSTCASNQQVNNTCLCNKDHTPNLALTVCYKGFGKACNVSSTQDECNKDQGLSCINSKCKCASNDQTYEKTRQLCVSNENKRCSLGSGRGTEEPLQCLENHTCARFSPNSMYGYCKKSSTSSATTNSVFYTLLITMQFYVMSS